MRAATAPGCTRRTLLRAGACGSALGLLGCTTTAGSGAGTPRSLAFGICAGLGRATPLAHAGAEYLEESVQGLLQPDQDDAGFLAKLPAIQAAAIPVRACNGFLPGRLKSVGPAADHAAVLAFAERAFARARRCGIDTITFGSAGSRGIPDGFAKADAERQFVALLAAMGPRAQAHGVTIGVEPLNATECNFLQRIGEVDAIVRAVDHDHVRTTADLYHMAHGGDAPADLARALDRVHHLHVAAPGTRALPGRFGEDWVPWFRVLADAGWRGRISIEANSGGADDAAFAKAFAHLRAHARTAGLLV